MQISLNKKMKHRNAFKVFKMPKAIDLFGKSRNISVPSVNGITDQDERLLDSISRTNYELNSEAYEHYAKLASQEENQQDVDNESTE